MVLYEVELGTEMDYSSISKGLAGPTQNLVDWITNQYGDTSRILGIVTASDQGDTTLSDRIAVDFASDADALLCQTEVSGVSQVFPANGATQYATLTHPFGTNVLIHTPIGGSITLILEDAQGTVLNTITVLDGSTPQTVWMDYGVRHTFTATPTDPSFPFVEWQRKKWIDGSIVVDLVNPYTDEMGFHHSPIEMTALYATPPGPIQKTTRFEANVGDPLNGDFLEERSYTITFQETRDYDGVPHKLTSLSVNGVPGPPGSLSVTVPVSTATSITVLADYQPIAPPVDMRALLFLLGLGAVIYLQGGA